MSMSSSKSISNQSLDDQLSNSSNSQRAKSISSLLSGYAAKQARTRKNKTSSSSPPSPSIRSFAGTFSFVLSCGAPVQYFPEPSLVEVKNDGSIAVLYCDENMGFEIDEEVSLKTAYTLYRVWEITECDYYESIQFECNHFRTARLFPNRIPLQVKWVSFRPRFVGIPHKKSIHKCRAGNWLWFSESRNPTRTTKRTKKSQ